MRHKRYLMLIYFVSCILLFVPYNVFGHPGRTDSHGGHYDHNTGSYHYHHGKPAHLHPNGICPYMPTQSKDVVSSENSAPPAESLSYKETANSSPSKIEWTNNKNQLFGFKILVCVLSILIFLILYYLFKSNKKHSLQLSVVCKEKEDIESEYTALKSTNWVQKINQMESEKNELIQISNELRTEISALQQELKNTKDYLHSVEYEKLVKIHEIESLQLQIDILKTDLAKAQNATQKVVCALTQQEEQNQFFQNQLQTLTVDALPFPKELLYEAGVPSGVTFDSNYLPHYYVQPTVEKHMRVYISRNGKCYHRQFGCSEATKPIHLFIAAQKYAPCERCIPYKARKYKVPDWYFEFLKLVDQYSKEVQQLESKN